MSIISKANSIQEKLDLLQNLDNAEFLEENGITQEEAEQFQLDLWNEIQQAEWDIISFAWHIMQQRQDALILSEWTWSVIEKLQKTKSIYDKKISKSESTLLWIMGLLKKEEILTPLWKIITKESSSMIVEDTAIELLPEELIKLSFVWEVDKEKLEDYEKVWLGIAKTPWNKTQITKWYKEEIEWEEWEEKKKKFMESGLYIKSTAVIKFK